MTIAAHTLRVDGDRLKVPASAYTHAGFRAWVLQESLPAHTSASFVEGEVLIEMSPQSTETHGKVAVELTAVLGTLIKREGLGEYHGDRTLLTHEAAGLSTEPDGLFLSWDAIETGRVRFVPKVGRDDDFVEVVGSPDLVIEIVSDSSQRKDEVALRTAYARASIPEYWLIDARGGEIRFAILQLEEGEYRAPADAGGSQQSRALGRTFSLSRRLGRHDRWIYDLTVG